MSQPRASLVLGLPICVTGLLFPVASVGAWQVGCLHGHYHTKDRITRLSICSLFFLRGKNRGQESAWHPQNQ